MRKINLFGFSETFLFRNLFVFKKQAIFQTKLFLFFITFVHWISMSNNVKPIPVI